MEAREYKNMFHQENDHWWYKTLHHLCLSVVRSMPKAGHLNIFDAGCGTGRLMQLLQVHGKVQGVDYAREAIGYCYIRGVDQAHQQDLNLWKPNEKYDLITSMDVLYHAKIKNDTAILEKFHEALAPNGTLILNLPAFNLLKRQHDLVVHTHRRYRKKALTEQLRHIGFEIELVSYRMPHLFLAILLIKAWPRSNRNPKPSSDVKPLPKALNQIMYRLGKWENRWLLNKCTIPFGSSVFVIVRKKTR
jgi:SAM-dependent methyltransferase